jgi:hypothetical protein
MAIVEYKHHDINVFVREDLKGKHREYCLCWQCKKLIPEDRTLNCPIANSLFAFDQRNNVTTPVFECPIFEDKNEATHA